MVNTLIVVVGLVVDLVCEPVNRFVLPVWDRWTGQSERDAQDRERLRRALWTDGTP